MGVILGEHDLSSDEAQDRHHTVQHVVLHPGFDPSNGKNDVALLKLREAITYNPAIQPVCVADRDEVEGTSCVSLDWQGTANDDCSSSISSKC